MADLAGPQKSGKKDEKAKKKTRNPRKNLEITEELRTARKTRFCAI